MARSLGRPSSTVSAAAFSALLLLALAGGFLFAAICEYTRYPSLRGEGQQLYFFASVFAVLLVLTARLLISVGRLFIPGSLRSWLNGLWEPLAGPLNTDALLTFFVAFCLGPILAGLINLFTDSGKIARNVIAGYGGRLERFLYDSILNRQLIYVALNSRKVYIGWAVDIPKPKPRREESREHFTLLPLQSGFLNDKLEPEVTTEYEPVYLKVITGAIEELSIADFQIVVPLDEVAVVRAYSLDLRQDMFKR
ncbi:hypothetical protein BH20ACT10_BH20ACT10_21350 [soil metagenome]